MAIRIPQIDEIELDRAYSRDAMMGPRGLTDIIISGQATEQRIVKWPTPRAEYTIQFVTKYNTAKWKNLVTFVRARDFNARGFRFFDWSDHDDDGHGSVELIDGIYRLVRTYPDDINPKQRLIFKPIADTIDLSQVPGTGAVLGADVAVDITTGIVTGATDDGPATFQYNIPVRFNLQDDHLSFKADPAKVVIWEGIRLVELVGN